jgi:hypothetical protein
MGWVGWVWSDREGAWRPVCKAPSLAACARLLDHAGRRLQVAGSRQVMTTGAAPTFRPKGQPPGKPGVPAGARSTGPATGGPP